MINIGCGYLGGRKQRYEMTVQEHYERTTVLLVLNHHHHQTCSNHHILNGTQCLNPCMVKEKTLPHVLFDSMLKRGAGRFCFSKQ